MQRKQIISQMILEVLSAEDHARFGQMSPQEFDQSPFGWREKAHSGTPDGFHDAYDAIRKRMRIGDTKDYFGRSGMLWHAAQMAAFAGNTRKAERIMGRKSLHHPESPEWNNYVAGTRSFLRGDRLGMQRAVVNTLRNPKRIDSKGNEIKDLNTEVLMRLHTGMRQGKSYPEVY